MSLEAVLDQVAGARPGYTLVSFKEAAIPVYMLTARILTLERKPLNPIEEGCLRAVDAGLDTPDDISSFLGLQDVVLTTILASLNAQELINYSRGVADDTALVALTVKGQQAIAESKLTVPQERIVKLVFDPFLKKLIFQQSTALWKPREVKEAGWYELPLCGAKRPEVEDVPLEEIDRALSRLRRERDESSELLALRRIERREMYFLPATLLYYKATSGDEVQVAFYKEDGFSLDHENAFRALGGPDQIDAKSVLTPLNRVPDKWSEVLDNSDSGPEIPKSGNDTPSRPRDEEAAVNRVSKHPTMRIIRCHEHPAFLKKALSSSLERMLIVSPWIRDQVVDKNFVSSLDALLRNGVSVYIGYGLVDENGNPQDRGRSKPAISRRAQGDLEELQAKHKEFSFRFVGNTHRKVLVSDYTFGVNTSFNWLSFKGDPKEKARDESGTLISKPEYVDELFRDALDLIQKGYEHPRAGTR